MKGDELRPPAVFTGLVDLAARGLGGRTLGPSDDFFASVGQKQFFANHFVKLDIQCIREFFYLVGDAGLGQVKLVSGASNTVFFGDLKEYFELAQGTKSG